MVESIVSSDRLINQSIQGGYSLCSVPRMTTAGILGDAAAVISKQFLSFAFIGALVGIPDYFIVLGMDIQGVLHGKGASGTYWAWTALGTLLANVEAAMLIYVTYQTMRGRRVTPGLALRRGLGLIPEAIGTAVVLALAIMVGTLCFIVPGYIAMAAYAVAVPVSVVERRSPMACLGRSGQLTKGYRWSIFGTLFLLGLLYFVVTICLMLLFRNTTSQVFAVLMTLLSVVLEFWRSAVVAIVYHHVRVLKEGVDIEELAAVFD